MLSLSLLSTAPTVSADAAEPGISTDRLVPLFPAATTNSTPVCALSASAAWLMGSVPSLTITDELNRDIAHGDSARVLAGTPIKLGLFDDRYGLVPLEIEPAALESIVIIHRSALLSGLSVLFETLWEHALPLHVEVDKLAGPTEEEAALLQFLVAGLPDESAARQLGISYSTLQRRLRRLMIRLGATTRFQAGLRAANLGWLPDDR